ncbi:MAG: hypothetical protein A2020_07515 [Lentisphaerae bacterium GWF2_45_14]|nr:MAG: hypothetical protein A2020_07515 [Lentisphaerae bacterium GWF2_45_14]
MPDVIEFLKESRYNRKKRKTVLLIGVAVLLVLIFLIRLVSCGEKELPVEGSERVLMCFSCDNREIVKVKDMHKETHLCSKCHAKLSRCLKCGDCEFEFPFSDTGVTFSSGTNKTQKFNRLNELRKCPKCGSVNTHMLSPAVIEQRNGKKKQHRN